MTRELRRLWEVEVYDGDSSDPHCPTKIETVIAFNAVDAIRKCGSSGVVKQPVALHYVTWPPLLKPTAPLLKITSTRGPTDEEVAPTIAVSGEDPRAGEAMDLLANTEGPKTEQ